MGFFDSLLGKSSARDAQQLGVRNAAQINASTDKANDFATQGYDKSMGFYQPFAETGQRGYNLYADTYGLNGNDARQRAFQTYQSDPFNAHSGEVTNNLLRNIMRTSASRGMGNSGATQLAMARAGLDAQDRRISDWRNGLQGFANQGLQVAGQQAGLTSGYYGGMADREIGRGQGLVQNDTMSTQAQSAARQQGINNLLSIGGTIANLGGRMLTGGFR